MPVPENVTLKQAADFKLIGTPAKRLDAPSKIDGTAIYGIDARPPGVKIATLAQSPVFGGRVKRVDDAAAKAVRGVRQIVWLDDAVAVVADHMGAAKKGLAALKIEWDDGQHAKLATADIARELETATTRPGAVAQNIGDVDKAMEGAATRIEANYQVPFLGADELHGACPVRRLRNLGRQPGACTRPGVRRKNPRHSSREGGRAEPSPGRWIRP
jgi:isoquinoline 1-oxidoreductase beta subunit